MVQDIFFFHQNYLLELNIPFLHWGAILHYFCLTYVTQAFFCICSERCGSGGCPHPLQTSFLFILQFKYKSSLNWSGVNRFHIRICHPHEIEIILKTVLRTGVSTAFLPNKLAGFSVLPSPSPPLFSSPLKWIFSSSTSQNEDDLLFFFLLLPPKE